MSATSQDVHDPENPFLPGESSFAHRPREQNSPIIYRVPKRLSQPCIPTEISIGPLHHGEENLKAMEEDKNKYLDYLIYHTGKSKDYYIKLIVENEERLRACYEVIQLRSKDFVEIILVDAAFIIVLLLRIRYQSLRDDDDRICGIEWKVQEIWLDILLLENQLPFFILVVLMKHFRIEYERKGQAISPCILDLLRYFFQTLMHVKIPDDKWGQMDFSNIKHFVDFQRRLYRPWVQPPGELPKSIPSITMLYQAGVTFEAGLNENLVDLEFKNGTLKIPKLVIGYRTDISIRNLLAFEQMCREDNMFINDYVALMNLLIKTQKDVDLLVREGIVEDRLQRGKFLFHELSQDVQYPKLSCFCSLTTELHDHCDKLWPKWRAYLLQNYFGRPGPALAFVISVVALILNFAKISR